MVARRVSCSTQPLLRPLSLGHLTRSLFDGVWSRALYVSAHSTHHVLALPLTHASNSGARLQPQSIVSRSSTQASRFCSQRTLTCGSPFSRSVVHGRRTLLFCLLCRRSCSLIPWCFGTLQISLLTVVVPLLTSFSQHHSGSHCCTCASLSLPAFFRPHVVLLPSRHSTPSRKSPLTVLSFVLVVAPPGPAHAQGHLSGGMMRATTLLLLATALGVTFVALGHLRIRLVSASCVNSSTAQFVPPGPTSGTSGLVL